MRKPMFLSLALLVSGSVFAIDGSRTFIVRQYGDSPLPGFVHDSRIELGGSVALSQGSADVIGFKCLEGTLKTAEVSKERYILYVANQGSAAEVKIIGMAVLGEESLEGAVVSAKARKYKDEDYARTCREDYVRSITLGGKLVYSLTILGNGTVPLPPTMTIVADSAAEALSRFNPLVERYRTDYHVSGTGSGLTDPRPANVGIEAMFNLVGKTPMERLVNYVENLRKTPRGELVQLQQLTIEVEPNPVRPEKTWIERIQSRFGN